MPSASAGSTHAIIMSPSTTKHRASTGASAVNLAIVQNDLEHVKVDVSDIKAVLSTMSNSLQGITRIEERQINVVSSLERGERNHLSHDARLKAIESRAPQWDEMRTWVIRGVIAGVTMLFTGVISVSFGVFADRIIPKAPQQVYVVPAPAVASQSR